MVKVSVVILNWNGAKLLTQFLPSVVKYTSNEDCEVVVADNGSTDNSIDLLTKSFPSVKRIELHENYGFADGYNRAIKQLNTRYVLLLNSDVEVVQSWLDPLVEYMDANDDVAACGPKILDYKDKRKFEYAGAAGGFIDRNGYPFCRGRILNSIEEDNGQFDVKADVLWVSGCALMVRKTVFDSEGGLDGRFFAHMEEVDFCWRLKNRGYRIVCIPQSTVYHLGGASLSAANPQKTFLNFRNSLLCLYKNLPEDEFFSSYIRRVILDTTAALKFLISDGNLHFMAVVNAHSAFWKLKKEYRNDRRECIKKMQVYDLKEVYPHSIVWAYYVRNWKKFSDLSL